MASLKAVIDKQIPHQLNKPSDFLESDRSLKIEEAEWFTSKEAAEFLRVSEGTLRNMTSNGKIPYAKLGRSNRYNRYELNTLILSNKRGLYGN